MLMFLEIWNEADLGGLWSVQKKNASHHNGTLENYIFTGNSATQVYSSLLHGKSKPEDSFPFHISRLIHFRL